MGRKSSDGSGVGTELLHALGLNRFTNTTDDSEAGDNKLKGQSKFGKLKFTKSKKKSKNDYPEVDSDKISMEIDLKAGKDNMETEQANERSSVLSLVDVQNRLESILEEMEKSLSNVKKNMDVAETCLENVYISVDKLEKFTELCTVENKDVILGLHKLVSVHKGAALLSTFSSDPTFKKNCDYNVSDADGKSVERRFENKRFTDTNIRESDSESNVANVIETHNSNNSETKPAFVKYQSYDIKKCTMTKVSGVLDTDSVSTNSKKSVSLNSEALSSNNPLKSKDSFSDQFSYIKDSNSTFSDKASNHKKSPKENKVSKTEKFKEKLNLKMRKKKETHDYDGDSAEAEHSSGYQTKIEKFKKRFDRKSK